MDNYVLGYQATSEGRSINHLFCNFQDFYSGFLSKQRLLARAKAQLGVLEGLPGSELFSVTIQESKDAIKDFESLYVVIFKCKGKIHQYDNYFTVQGEVQELAQITVPEVSYQSELPQWTPEEALKYATEFGEFIKPLGYTEKVSTKEVFGYKIFKKKGKQLVGPMYSEYTYHSGENIAECLGSFININHSINGCTCGFYFLKTQAQAQNEKWSGNVIKKVRGYGDIVEGSKGYKTSKLEILDDLKVKIPKKNFLQAFWFLLIYLPLFTVEISQGISNPQGSRGTWLGIAVISFMFMLPMCFAGVWRLRKGDLSS